MTFAHQLGLKFSDDKFDNSNDIFTFRTDSRGAASVIDHIAVSECL